MLTAVSLLSPVSIHIFIPAFRNACIVSGTPSCRRSSMPVAPLFRQADGLALLYFKNQVCKRDRTRESLCVSTFQTSCCAFGIKNNRRMEYLISWQYVKLTVLHLTSYRKSFDKKKKKECLTVISSSTVYEACILVSSNELTRSFALLTTK